MSRESFHQELDRLVHDALQLGREVQGSLESMVEAMKDWDAGMARKEIGVDSRYKERGVELEEECMVLQARQAPVARDLRLIHTLHAVINHMVRAGTLCEHIFHTVADTADRERDPDLEAILFQMAWGARDLFRRGLDVFEYSDIERARDLEAADDKIDLLYSEAMNLVVNPGKEEAGAPEWRIRAALSVHYLERIADHGVDIGGRTVSLVTGERMESAMNQYRKRLLDSDED